MGITLGTIDLILSNADNESARKCFVHPRVRKVRTQRSCNQACLVQRSRQCTFMERFHRLTKIITYLERHSTQQTPQQTTNQPISDKRSHKMPSQCYAQGEPNAARVLDRIHAGYEQIFAVYSLYRVGMSTAHEACTGLPLDFICASLDKWATVKGIWVIPLRQSIKTGLISCKNVVYDQ